MRIPSVRAGAQPLAAADGLLDRGCRPYLLRLVAPRGAELHRSLSSGPLGCRFPGLGGAANVFALMGRPILIRAFPAQMPSPGVEYSRR